MITEIFQCKEKQASLTILYEFRDSWQARIYVKAFFFCCLPNAPQNLESSHRLDGSRENVGPSATAEFTPSLRRVSTEFPLSWLAEERPYKCGAKARNVFEAGQIENAGEKNEFIKWRFHIFRAWWVLFSLVSSRYGISLQLTVNTVLAAQIG